MKLFLHEILPADIDRAIFVDTDAMFIVDPYRESSPPSKTSLTLSRSRLEPIQHLFPRHPLQHSHPRKRRTPSQIRLERRFPRMQLYPPARLAEYACGADDEFGFVRRGDACPGAGEAGE